MADLLFNNSFEIFFHFIPVKMGIRNALKTLASFLRGNDKITF